MSAAPKWFNNCIVSGIQGLYALGLPGCPAAELLEATTEVWITTLWHRVPTNWDEQLDCTRLAQAFQQLALTSERWPVPAHLVKALPSRPAPIALPEPISRSGPSPEVKARLMRSIKELAGKMTRTPWSN